MYARIQYFVIFNKQWSYACGKEQEFDFSCFPPRMDHAKKKFFDEKFFNFFFQKKFHDEQFFSPKIRNKSLFLQTFSNPFTCRLLRNNDQRHACLIICLALHCNMSSCWILLILVKKDFFSESDALLNSWL